MRGLSLVAASGGHSSLRCAGLSLSRPLLLRSTGSRGAGSVAVAHGPSCSAARGIFPDQGSNPCPRHWQADSQPLRRQGSPLLLFKTLFWLYFYKEFLNFSSYGFMLQLDFNYQGSWPPRAHFFPNKLDNLIVLELSFREIWLYYPCDLLGLLTFQ